jgi:hypothetical protein
VHFLKIPIYSKRVNTSNVIDWGTCQYFKEHVAKTFLQKILSMKKSKCSRKAHLWLNPLPLLACLIVITPKTTSLEIKRHGM